MTTEKDIYNEQIEEEKLEIITEYIEERYPPNNPVTTANVEYVLK